jgi:type VI secretion system protein ImpA
MPSPQVIDLEALLAPIPGENPAGQDVMYEGTHDAIKEARRADDGLSLGEWSRDVKVADWSAVIALAQEALATKSKDLQVAAWLVEALVKRHGFAGLRDGLCMLWELQQRFWPSLYPTIEDGDLEARVLLLEGLNKNLAAAVKDVPVTQGRNGENYSWFRWEESRMVDNLGRRDQAAMAEAIADGKITGEQFTKAVEATPLTYYRTLFDDLQQSWEAYSRLEQVVDEHFGREAPSLAEVRTAVDNCRMLIADVGKQKGGLGPPPGPAIIPAPPVDRSSTETTIPVSQEPQHDAALSVYNGQPSGTSLEPQSRADALRRLEALAAYFRRTEPHSPVSYLVQRAVRWGEMPLEAWLQDVINDDTVLSRVRETLGLKDPNGSSQT